MPIVLKESPQHLSSYARFDQELSLAILFKAFTSICSSVARGTWLKIDNCQSIVRTAISKNGGESFNKEATDKTLVSRTKPEFRPYRPYLTLDITHKRCG